MSKYIKNLISQGENQQLDFKFEIDDSKKIARTFVAFANTDGGKLLIGVKDNGKISGIRTEEEYHMAEAAGQMYCKPKVNYKIKEWKVEGKTILEVNIEKSDKKPHFAPGKNNKWMVWIRVQDQNIQAHDVLIKAWNKKNKKLGTFIHYSETEKILLDFLNQNPSISLTKFCKIAKINRIKAKNILSDLISINIIEASITDKNTTFKLIK